jgi:flagellin
MGLRINQNVEAMNAYRHLTDTNNTMSKSLERLSSGLRINRASDDAAGLSISEKLRSQIGGFKVATQNAQDGISMLQTAEGALNETTSLLQRIRDLAVQAANGTQDTASRTAADSEVQQNLNEIDRIAKATSYGNLTLLNAAQSFTFQVGGTTQSYDQIAISVSAMDATGLSVAAGTANSVGTVAGASAMLVKIDAAISAVSAQRSTFGAVQNRLEHTVANLGVAVENLSASESRIRDTDMASEMVSFTKSQILSQAGTAMLAQANQAPQNVLSLLRG